LKGERVITEEDAWREVNRPFVVAGVALAALAAVALVVAFLLAGAAEVRAKGAKDAKVTEIDFTLPVEVVAYE